VESEWDPAKARANFTKHGVRFADAVTALGDDSALTMSDLSSVDEERWVTMGLDAFGRLRVVVYTWRRAHAVDFSEGATPLERRQYEEVR
jgi:uncharacterized protein